MPYKAKICRENPSCLLFMIDQSGSMGDPFGGSTSGKTKADGVATAINRLLQNVVIKCTVGDTIRDYHVIGVIGYGLNVNSAFTGPLSGEELLPVSKIGTQPLRIEEKIKKVDDGAGGVINETIKFAVWVDPVAKGRTPMHTAFAKAKAIIEKWIDEHPDSFPPIVINITDGESTDADPSQVAEEIKSLATSDGQALLFNLHISSLRSDPIEFSHAENELPDKFAQQLFRMSSVLPEKMQEAAKLEGYAVADESRGFVFNGDIVAITRFLEIGTTPINAR